MLKKCIISCFSACYYFSCVLYSRFVDRKEDEKKAGCDRKRAGNILTLKKEEC